MSNQTKRRDMIRRVIARGGVPRLIRQLLDAGADPKEIIEAAAPMVRAFPASGDNFRTVGRVGDLRGEFDVHKRQ